jgi:uncharacterized protein (DUF1330 family)
MIALEEDVMAAYFIVSVKSVSDPDTFYKEYGSRFAPTLAGYDAKVLAASPGESIEGGWQRLNIVVIEFPDMDTLKRWYHSDAYQEIIPLRQRSADVDILFVDGYTPPAAA